MDGEFRLSLAASGFVLPQHPCDRQPVSSQFQTIDTLSRWVLSSSFFGIKSNTTSQRAKIPKIQSRHLIYEELSYLVRLLATHHPSVPSHPACPILCCRSHFGITGGRHCKWLPSLACGVRAFTSSMFGSMLSRQVIARFPYLLCLNVLNGSCAHI